LLAACTETTTNLIDNAVIAPLDHSDQLAQLRADASRISAALELIDAGMLGRHVARSVEHDHALGRGEPIEEPPRQRDVGHAIDAGMREQCQPVPHGRRAGRHVASMMGMAAAVRHSGASA
jgi:cytochrome P450